MGVLLTVIWKFIGRHSFGCGPNPFQTIYERLIGKGVRDSLARLTVARKLLSVPWGLWKRGREYDPTLVT